MRIVTEFIMETNSDGIKILEPMALTSSLSLMNEKV